MCPFLFTDAQLRYNSVQGNTPDTAVFKFPLRYFKSHCIKCLCKIRPNRLYIFDFHFSCQIGVLLVYYVC